MTQAPSPEGFLTRTPSAKRQRSGRGWWQPTRQLSGHRTGSRWPTAQSAAPSPLRVPWKDEQVLLRQHNQGPTSPPHPAHPTEVTPWARSRPGPENSPALGHGGSSFQPITRNPLPSRPSTQVLRGAGHPQVSLKAGREAAWWAQARG